MDYYHTFGVECIRLYQQTVNDTYTHTPTHTQWKLLSLSLPIILHSLLLVHSFPVSFILAISILLFLLFCSFFLLFILFARTILFLMLALFCSFYSLPLLLYCATGNICMMVLQWEWMPYDWFRNSNIYFVFGFHWKWAVALLLLLSVSISLYSVSGSSHIRIETTFSFFSFLFFWDKSKKINKNRIGYFQLDLITTISLLRCISMYIPTYTQNDNTSKWNFLLSQPLYPLYSILSNYICRRIQSSPSSSTPPFGPALH